MMVNMFLNDKRCTRRAILFLCWYLVSVIFFKPTDVVSMKELIVGSDHLKLKVRNFTEKAE